MDVVNAKLVRCTEKLMEEFDNTPTHFVLFVFQATADGESIEATHVASLPPAEMRTIVMGILSEDAEDVNPTFN
jgi:hypothetical protein